MKDTSGIDLGTIKIHKKVLAEIVRNTINSLKGGHVLPVFSTHLYSPEDSLVQVSLLESVCVTA